jgi:hypothetical protein
VGKRKHCESGRDKVKGLGIRDRNPRDELELIEELRRKVPPILISWSERKALDRDMSSGSPGPRPIASFDHLSLATHHSPH